MDIITKTINEFEEITGVKASKFNLNFICGFMACHELMNKTILYLDPTPEQLVRFDEEWKKIKEKGKL